jgi:hypothetical protein
MPKRTFTKEFLTDELDLPFSAIEKKIIDQGRWETHYEIIFAHEGKYYATGYSRGSTEMQDEGPDFGGDEVECDEVHQVEKVVKVWEEVK